MKIAVVQPITHASPDDERNVKDAVAHIEAAAVANADFVVFPESYPGPWRMPMSFDPTAAMVDAAAQSHLHVVFGTMEPIDETAGTAHQLTVLAYPDGRAPGVYRRTHPPGPWLYTGGSWEFQYVAADEFPVFGTEHGTVGLGVCSEVYMPEVSRALALRGAEIIFLPAGVPKPELWHTWRTLTWARAIENLAIVVTTQNMFATSDLGLAMVASPGSVVFESRSSGIFYVDVDLDEVRRLRSEEDGPLSRNAAKAGVLTQWQRPELYGKLLPASSK